MFDNGLFRAEFCCCLRNDVIIVRLSPVCLIFWWHPISCATCCCGYDETVDSMKSLRCLPYGRTLSDCHHCKSQRDSVFNQRCRRRRSIPTLRSPNHHFNHRFQPSSAFLAFFLVFIMNSLASCAFRISDILCAPPHGGRSQWHRLYAPPTHWSFHSTLWYRRRRKHQTFTISSYTSPSVIDDWNDACNVPRGDGGGEANSRSDSQNANRTIYTIDYCPATDPIKLQGIVRKHVETLPQYLKHRPVAYHTHIAFSILQNQLRKQFATTETDRGQLDDPQRRNTEGDKFLSTHPIVLDSGCGTGRSTILLGEMYPQAIVIGVDRSLLRLTKNQNVKKEYIPVDYTDGTMDYFVDKSYQPRNKRIQQEIFSSVKEENDDDSDAYNPDDPTRLVEQVASNVWLVRAELVDFWRLMIQHAWFVQHHYLLYPNPYPKLTRVQQRWYAHPSFPLLFQLLLGHSTDGTVVNNDKHVTTTTTFENAATMTIRSNWSQYLREFATGAQCAADPNRMTMGPIRQVVRPASVEEMKAQAWTNFEEKYWLVNEPTYELRIVGAWNQ